MEAANEEFKELFERSGWKSQSEAARQLDLPPPSISRYISGEDKPSKQTLRLFRLLLADAPSARKEIREHGTRDDITIWRNRAKKAEQENDNIKRILRAVIDSNLLSELSVKQISSAPSRTGHTDQTKVPFPQFDEAIARMTEADLKKNNAGGSTPEPPAPPKPTKKIQ